MACSLPAAPALPPPVSLTLRAVDPGADAEAIHALDAAAFAGAPDYEPETLEGFRAEHLCGPGFAPELTLLLARAFAAFAAGGLAEAQLGVASDNLRARRLYERVGMRERVRREVYERPR
jgi:hypothetical protein